MGIPSSRARGNMPRGVPAHNVRSRRHFRERSQPRESSAAPADGIENATGGRAPGGKSRHVPGHGSCGWLASVVVVVPALVEHDMQQGPGHERLVKPHPRPFARP